VEPWSFGKIQGTSFGTKETEVLIFFIGKIHEDLVSDGQFYYFYG
jgi:hypothetical protein